MLTEDQNERLKLRTDETEQEMLMRRLKEIEKEETERKSVLNQAEQEVKKLRKSGVEKSATGLSLGMSI